MATASLNVNVGASIKGLQDEFKKANRSLGGFQKQVKALGGVIAGAFAVREVVQFGKEAFLMSEKFKGIKSAFESLEGSDKLFKDIREATGGAVNKLELMQRSVQAINLGIDQNKLAKFFEFATIRAAETGESVDYLVDSIVKGVGRGSIQILDNLGISAQQLGKGFASASNKAEIVAKIIDQQLKKSSLTVADAVKGTDKLKASWDNLKLSFGNLLNTDGSKNLLSFLASIVDEVSSMVNQVKPKLIEFANFFITLYNESTEFRFAVEALKITFSLLWRTVKQFFENTFEGFAALAKIIASIIARDSVTVVRVIRDFGKNIIDDFRRNGEQTAREFIEGMRRVHSKEKIPLIPTEEEKKNVIKAYADLGQSAIQAFAVDKIGAFGPDMSDLQKTIDLFNQQKAAIDGVTNAYKMQKVQVSELSEMQIPMEEILRRIGKVMIDTSSIVQNLASTAFTSLGESFGAVLSGAANFGDSILKTFADFAKGLGQMLIQTGVAMLAARKLLANPITAIGAGVALVALASAFQARAQNSINSLGGGGSSGSLSRTGFNEQAIARRDKESMQLVASIKGTDLVFLLNKVQKNQTRTHG